MKTNLIKIILFTVALALLLGGCAYISDEQGQTTDKTAEYLNTIATLESTLEEERSNFEQAEATYKQTIAELEAKVAYLSTMQSPTPDTEDSVQFRYRVENGGAVITGYEGHVALLTVPDTLDGYPVISIGERAFEGADMTAVVLPDGLQEIGWFGFYNCHNLSNVTIPQSVSSIGYAVFDGCGALTVYCPANCYAERYARSYGISYITT